MRKYPLYARERILDLKQLPDPRARLCIKKEALKKITGRSESTSVTYGQFHDGLYAILIISDYILYGKPRRFFAENLCKRATAYFAVAGSVKCVE